MPRINKKELVYVPHVEGTDFVYIPQPGFHIDIVYNAKDAKFACSYEGQEQATGYIIKGAGTVIYDSLAGFCSLHRVGLAAYLQGIHDTIIAVQRLGIAYIMQ